MLVKVLQNSRSEWYWVCVDQGGNTVEQSPEQYPTRQMAVTLATERYAHEQVGFMVDGVTRGRDEEPVSLPRVNARIEAERAGVP
jgi:hypothetical protein